jgi:hypothetical protein
MHGGSTPDLDRSGPQLKPSSNPTTGGNAAVTGGPARKNALGEFLAHAFPLGRE